MSEDYSLDSLILDCDHILENSIFETLLYMSADRSNVKRYSNQLNQLYNAYNSKIVTLEEIAPEIQDYVFDHFKLKTDTKKPNYFGHSALSSLVIPTFTGLICDLIFDDPKFIIAGFTVGLVFAGNNLFWNWYENRRNSKNTADIKAIKEETRQTYNRLFHYSEKAWVDALNNLEPRLTAIL